MGIRTYKDLIVWQKAVGLTVKIHTVTKLFPKEEMYGIISQMRRCAISISSNIAEGTSRGTRKDYCQFLRIALGSCSELETQLIISEKLKYIPSGEFSELSSLVNEIMKMLNSIIKNYNLRLADYSL